MKPGVRVIRGPDWALGDTDGGLGYLGTVTSIYPNNTVLVGHVKIFLFHIVNKCYVPYLCINCSETVHSLCRFIVQ